MDGYPPRDGALLTLVFRFRLIFRIPRRMSPLLLLPPDPLLSPPLSMSSEKTREWTRVYSVCCTWHGWCWVLPRPRRILDCLRLGSRWRECGAVSSVSILTSNVTRLVSGFMPPTIWSQQLEKLWYLWHTKIILDIRYQKIQAYVYKFYQLIFWV